jgi:hypothetical protein
VPTTSRFLQRRARALQWHEPTNAKARATGDTQTILTTDGKNAQAVAALLEAKPRAAARGNLGIEGLASDPIDDVQLQLLLGKVYSEWKGHRCDAAATAECVE